MTESAAPSSIPYGTSDTLSVSGLAVGATGTITFTSGGSTLCTATLAATSCATSTTLAPGTYPVTATYSGDSNYTGAVATGASFIVTKADTSMTETASPPSIGYGSQDTLSVAGLPAGATGTVIFTSGGSTLCTTTLAATSCQTAATLAPGAYPVTATYSGDGDYNGTIATGASFTVTKADPVLQRVRRARERSLRQRRHPLRDRPSRRRNRERDVHVGRIDALRHHPAHDGL